MSLPTSLSALIILISAAAPLASAAGPPLTDSSKCGCFLTNGTESRYFSHHAFYDFRSQSQYAGVPPVISDAASSAGAPVTSKFFSSSAWTNDWIMGNWNNSQGGRADAAVFMVHSPNNVYIEANDNKGGKPDTWLTFRTQRFEKFQSAAEIESLSKAYQFLSVRMLSRTFGGKGAITALFTYLHSENVSEVQEADLEVLTKGEDNIIHYTNQPGYSADGKLIPQATVNATMPDGLKWTDWAIHRLDWTPTRNTWYVNGQQVAQISFQTPRDPSKIILNAWSDGGQWSGNMSVGDSAYMQVQWLEVVFNSTDTSAGHSRRRQIEGRGSSVSNGVCNSSSRWNFS
ncbi:beta-glucanase [Echria macrotheca]|uniref:Beta-glucanase n=1 Tax=Echria macrotheca TaxID=438768 RepID=A0AAJ0B7T9_9PEZI|nr:beta-glucanase [Echria macrotheca]